MRFKNKIALVTGATSGIGKKIVEKLIKEECKVIATSKENISLKLVFSLRVEKNVPIAAIPNKEIELVSNNKKNLSKTGT